MRFRPFSQLAWPLFLLYIGCTPIPPSMESPGSAGRTSQRSGHIYITDRYGERFDITHAVEKYGMSRHGFEHGIGKNTIHPLDHPNMIGPGKPDYPNARDDTRVIGTEIDGDVRSYPIPLLARHEIVNETIGGTAAAVAY
jgi:hypothetical protein